MNVPENGTPPAVPEGGPVMQMVVQYQPQTNQVRFVGPIDEHPELCLRALARGIEAVAEKMLQDRSSDLVRVRPKIIRPMLLAALLCAATSACVGGAPFEPEDCALQVNGDTITLTAATLQACPSPSPSWAPPQGRVLKGGRP